MAAVSTGSLPRALWGSQPVDWDRETQEWEGEGGGQWKDLSGWRGVGAISRIRILSRTLELVNAYLHLLELNNGNPRPIKSSLG